METITKEQLFGRLSDQSSPTVENYEVIDENVLIENVPMNKPLKNCKFKNLVIKNPMNVLTLENCTANNLIINGSHAHRMQITNCKILSLDITNSSMMPNSNGNTVAEISGIESHIQLITVKGQFNNVTVRNIIDVTQINFHFAKMDSVKIDSVSNALIKFQ